jgi:UPF0755 protein
VGKFLILVLLALAGAAAWFWYALEQPYQGFPAEGILVEIPHGSSSRGVAHLLERKGVVRSAAAFEIYTRKHATRSLQAGEYFFDHPTSGAAVFWKIANGEIFEQPFTVREGETMFDIARDLEAGQFMTGDEFLHAAKDPALIRDVVPNAPTLEGFLFPATYHLSKHPTAVALTSEMVKKFREEWASITSSDGNSSSDAADAGPPDAPSAGTAAGRPIVAVVTLASLVERETPKPEERPLVAGVFQNRLNKSMPLQCDPTVIYSLERLGKYKGSLSSADLRFESPYNTYVHTGLPPGPIGNPGVASLRAAYRPAQTDYLYFVANTQGGHFFSATLAEHNNNVMKYRHLLSTEQGASR